jgi:hypothetical protein
MNELLSLLQILGTTAMLVVPPILLARLIAGSGSASLAELLRFRADPPRPAGVQEEDQPAFRLEDIAPNHAPVSLQPERRTATPVRAMCADERAA